MNEAPIQLSITSVRGGKTNRVTLFDSYSFTRSLLTPASPFRFTAPGVEKELRLAIRSGDLVQLQIQDGTGNLQPLGTGFIDETDTHVSASSVEYVMSGRDTLGQLVDNAAVDATNKIFNLADQSMSQILSTLLKGTRVPKAFRLQQVPTGLKLFATNPGETKINALQRYLELTNCLVWCAPNGQVILGKPNFAQARSGSFVVSSSSPTGNNAIEARARRNVNQAIRQIVTQLQTFGQVDAGAYTLLNADPDMRALKGSGVGRSVYNTFTNGSGAEAVNQVTSVGSQSGNPTKMGADYSLREIARENVRILEVDIVVEGHLNSGGQPYNIDQIYRVEIEDDDVSEDMLVHNCSYELTADHGLMTRLQLCRLHTIVSGTEAVRRS